MLKLLPILLTFQSLPAFAGDSEGCLKQLATYTAAREMHEIFRSHVDLKPESASFCDRLPDAVVKKFTDDLTLKRKQMPIIMEILKTKKSVDYEELKAVYPFTELGPHPEKTICEYRDLKYTTEKEFYLLSWMFASRINYESDTFSSSCLKAQEEYRKFNNIR